MLPEYSISIPLPDPFIPVARELILPYLRSFSTGTIVSFCTYWNLEMGIGLIHFL